MKRLLLFSAYILACTVSTLAQSAKFFSLGVGGATVGAVYPTTSIPTYVGTIGQPLVYSRPTAFYNGGGVQNITGFLFSGAINGDATPPVITFSAVPGPTVIQGSQTVIDVTMTDNVNVASGRIYYRPITGGTFTQLELTALPNHVFEGVVPSSAPDNMGLEFYFEAFDSGNKTTSPVTGSYYAYFTLNPATMPVFSSVGNDAKNYRIMAMPLNMNNRNPSFIYSKLSDISQKTIRVWSYDPLKSGEAKWLEYPNDFTTMDQGKGYFVILGENKNFDLGQQKAPSNNRLNLYKETLQPGWNLFGNPYTVPVNWDDVKTFNGNPANLGTLKEYVSGAYTTSTTLDPYKGAFVFLNGSSPLEITIPFVGQTTQGGRIENEIVGSNLSNPKWKMNLNIKQGDVESKLSGFGMNPGASVSYDPFDDFNPPSFNEYAAIEFIHPEHSLKAFAFDVVPTAEKYVWRFTSKGNTSNDAELLWDNSSLGNNDIELYLYDESKNTVINMRTENKYAFSPATSGEFKIYYGKDIRPSISPDQVQVFAPYPNPFRTGSQITFDLGLPQNINNGHYSVQMDISNSVGMPVYQQAKDLNAGIYKLTWNAKNQYENDLTQGLYIYTIKVNGQVFSGKIILE